MPRDRETPRAGRALTLAAWACLLAAFMLPPLSYLGYPVYSIEYAVAVLLALALGGLLFWLRAVPLLHKLLLFAIALFLLLLYFYALAEPYGWLAIAAGSALAVIFAVLLIFDEPTALRIVAAACLGQVAVAAFSVPAETLLEWDENSPRSDLRPIVHILLDAHAGLAAIPQELRYLNGLRTLEDRYLAAGFTIFRRAYSAADETRASLSRLFNPRANSTQTGRFGMLKRAEALEQIGRNRALDLTQFEYSQIDPWLLRHHLNATHVRVINAGNAYSSIVRFGAAYWDRLKIALSGGISWVHLRSGFPLVTWAMDSTVPGQWIVNTIGVLKSPYVYIARGELIDYQKRLRCCGQRGTYHFLHTYIPHGPYIFDRDCNAKRTRNWEASEYGTAAAYRLRQDLFLDQALCASRDIMEIVKTIDSDPRLKDAMLIIHGDHGSRITADTDIARSELQYDDAARQRDMRATFLAIRDGQKPGAVIEDEVRIDAVFEALVESDFESLDLSRVRRYPDSPYSISAK